MQPSPLGRSRRLILDQLAGFGILCRDEPVAELTPLGVVAGRGIRVRESEDELDVSGHVGAGDFVDVNVGRVAE
jgi:hypothetical protein